MKKMKTKANSNYFTEVVVLLVIFHKCNIFTHFCSDNNHRSLLTVLFQNLTLDSHLIRSNEKILSEYENSLTELFQILVQALPSLSEWIYATPLFHLVTKQCKPSETLQSISWNFNKVSRRCVWV